VRQLTQVHEALRKAAADDLVENQECLIQAGTH
jgi:hypothetical protein